MRPQRGQFLPLTTNRFKSTEGRVMPKVAQGKRNCYQYAADSRPMIHKVIWICMQFVTTVCKQGRTGGS